ncbi:MAG: orotate phosphoribosyltransferase [Sphaerochaetaceae bacterium]|jgi:orotate phosphoribosyltransferase
MKKTIEEITGHYGPLLAARALDLGAIKLSPESPFQWASGYRMPIYNDNRQFLAQADSRAMICDAFTEMLDALDFHPENVAGTATAGIPHATTLADRLGLPLSYVRSSGKDHGLHQQIEGLGKSGSYEGRRVVLIEDLISTGGSSIKAVEAIVAAEGVCPYCLAIFTYGLKASSDAFGALTPPCAVHTILDYDIMVSTALRIGYVDEAGAALLRQWREDPFGWGEKHGFPPVK